MGSLGNQLHCHNILYFLYLKCIIFSIPKKQTNELNSAEWQIPVITQALKYLLVLTLQYLQWVNSVSFRNCVYFMCLFPSLWPKRISVSALQLFLSNTFIFKNSQLYIFFLTLRSRVDKPFQYMVKGFHKCERQTFKFCWLLFEKLSEIKDTPALRNPILTQNTLQLKMNEWSKAYWLMHHAT